jgi:hypothetical protein
MTPNRAGLQPIESRIVTVRGTQVVLDSDLARLYGVSTKVLLQAVRRNAERFPDDFMFLLQNQDLECLRSQIVTSNMRQGRGGRRSRPYAFTEQGVAMLSSVLRSPAAVAVNIEIMRAFVRLRRAALISEQLAKAVDELAGRVDAHDVAIKALVESIRDLIAPEPPPKRRPIGFVPIA